MENISTYGILSIEYLENQILYYSHGGYGQSDLISLYGHHTGSILSGEKVKTFKEILEKLRSVKDLVSNAIDETLISVSINAKLDHHYYDEYDNTEDFNKYKDHWTCRTDQDGIPYGVDVYSVNIKSILELSNELKKKLL